MNENPKASPPWEIFPGIWKVNNKECWLNSVKIGKGERKGWNFWSNGGLFYNMVPKGNEFCKAPREFNKIGKKVYQPLECAKWNFVFRKLTVG